MPHKIHMSRWLPGRKNILRWNTYPRFKQNMAWELPPGAGMHLGGAVLMSGLISGPYLAIWDPGELPMAPILFPCSPSVVCGKLGALFPHVHGKLCAGAMRVGLRREWGEQYSPYWVISSSGPVGPGWASSPVNWSRRVGPNKHTQLVLKG